MSDFEFFEPEDRYGAVKATAHRSGRLGFSSGANKLIDFERTLYFRIGRKKSEKGQVDEPVLFLVPMDVEDDKTFKVLKAGKYFYLKTKRLLNQLNIDYKNESVIYDIDEAVEEGRKVFKLTRKRRKKKKGLTIPEALPDPVHRKD